MTDALWQAKLLAYIHDPAEKALVLLRGRGHEEGTVSDLKRELFGDTLAELVRELSGREGIVKRADRFAAAADRPSLPRRMRTMVRFASRPELVHPLTGKTFRIADLAGDIDAAAIEAVSLDHFSSLIARDGESVDCRQTFLQFWRFGPELAAPKLGALWGSLPADTRSPDHGIWEHLKLTAAFAGAMAADPEEGPALLLVSFGPVQGFISQARSVSDLWAGSHLISRISWEGMRVVCERYGPDAVLFPDLLGAPFVDLWLEREGVEWPDDVARPWRDRASDANPLFAAAFPNRFVALVPRSAAEALAKAIEVRVRGWTREQAGAALGILEQSAGIGASHAHAQVERQLDRFPEVHWAVVPWSLAGADRLEDAPLRGARAALGAAERYLSPDLDGLVRTLLTVVDKSGEPVEFFAPNAGVAYPGLYDALERLHAAAKTTRPFDGAAERGYRCSVCGEREWLTHDPDLLDCPADQRGETLWSKAATEAPGLVKGNECLCAHCALKRLWPRVFKDELETAGILSEEDKSIRRYVVSTHVMALSGTVERHLSGRLQASADRKAAARAKLDKRVDRTAWPARLYRRLQNHENREDRDFLLRLPAVADLLSGAPGGSGPDSEEDVHGWLQDYFGERPEAYYALVLMDGDRMGAWLAGDEGQLPMSSRFHGSMLAELREKGLANYLDAEIPASPARHQAISTALNNFSLHLARVVVEELFTGKLIYAGGDDLLAMSTVHDLPGLMLALRCAYSGVLPDGATDRDWENIAGSEGGRLRLGHGYAWLADGGGRLLRMMGSGATASIGAVIAHHKAPLGRVLADLRAAEKRAKADGRDAYCITLEKRAGGTISSTGGWRLGDGPRGGEIGLLSDLRDVLARPDVSRRAAYLLGEVLRDVPPTEEALAPLLAFQLERQGAGNQDQLARRLAGAAVRRGAGPDGNSEWAACNVWLRDLIVTAEFLAREGRGGGARDKEAAA